MAQETPGPAPDVVLDSPKPSPSIVLDLILAFRRSKTMFAAVSLGIFDSLRRGRQSCAASPGPWV